MSKLDQIMARIEARAKTQTKAKNQPNEKTEGRDLNKNSVTKSNALARAYYRFSLVEKRVMEALISQLNPKSQDQSQLQKIELKAVDYAKTFSIPEKHAYEHIERAVSGLMHRVFSVAHPKGRKEFTLMSNAQYLVGEGRVSCSFNPYVVPHLIGLQNKFSKYPLLETVGFKSSYTWRIYEVLVSWAKDTKITDGILAGWFTAEIEELRQTLGVPASYRWSDFKRQVLDTAKTELLKKSNIELKIEMVKTGRKITHLKFAFAEIKKDKTPSTSKPIITQLSE